MKGAGQLRQPPGDLRLAHAGGADHHDVLRRDFPPHLGGQLLPPPTIADRDSHGPLGRVLADNVAIKFFNDLAWGQLLHDILNLLTMYKRL